MDLIKKKAIEGRLDFLVLHIDIYNVTVFVPGTLKVT